MEIRNSLRPLLVAGVLLAGGWTLLATGSGPTSAKSELPQAAPTVRVVSPDVLASYMLPSNGGRLLVVLEIADVTNAGIVLDGSGRPAFLDPDDNVRVFLDHVTWQSTYTDGFSHTVIQLASEVPLADLVRDAHWRITPLVDWNSVPPDAQASGIRVPKEKHLDLAVFRFRVKDKRGNASHFPTVAEGQELDHSFAVAVQDNLYVYKPAETAK